MARKKKQVAPVDPEERARLKKLRSLHRREARKLNRASRRSDTTTERKSSGALYADPTYQTDDYEWLRCSGAKSYAQKILNDCRDRPYWLSIPRSRIERTEPVAHYYPCGLFRTEERVYYSFLFREHRDLTFNRWREEFCARKETFDAVVKARNRRT